MKSLMLTIPILSVGLLISAFFILSFTLPKKGITDQGKSKTITIASEKQVGLDGASTKFSTYNTSPESPDGKQIIYLRYKVEPIDLERSAKVPGELWICDCDLKGHRLVTDIRGMSSEDGAIQQWLDNNHVALLDNGIIRVVDVRNGQDILKKRVETTFLGHDSFDGKVLFSIAESRGERERGIYELNCFTEEIKPVILNADCGNVSLPSYLGSEEVWPVEDWRILHCQYSPNGEKVSFRLDVGSSGKLRLLGLCNIDGSDFKIQNKALHFMWYDKESIIGHIRYGEHGEYLPPEKKWLLMRWDLNGKYIETMGQRGNHLALSPIRDCFVSETLYHTIPVIVTLIPKEQKDKTVEIARFDPYDLTWNRWFHVNPAFSRDGKRIYYSKPLNEKYNGTFMCELKYGQN